MDQSTQISSALAKIFEDEPAFSGTSSDITSLATARRRRRRRSIGVVASTAVIAGVALGASALSATWPGSGTQGPSSDPAQTFSPDALVDSIAESLTAMAPTTRALIATDVNALDAQDNLIEGADRDKATTWRGTFSESEDRVIEIRLSHESDTPIKSVRQMCAESVGSLNLSCELIRSDSTIVEAFVRAVDRQPGAWAVIPPAAVGSTKVDIWFQRQATAHHNGLTVSAIEFVRADSLAEARTTWVTAVEELTQIATNPEFWFPAPPDDSDEPGCGWVVPEADASFSCSG